MGVLAAIGTGLAAVGAGSATAGAAIVGGVASAAGSAISASKQAKAAKSAQKQQIKGIADLGRIREDLQNQALGGTFAGQFGGADIFGRRPDQIDLGESVRNAAQANIGNLGINQDFAQRANTSITDEAIRRASQFDPNFRENVRGLSAQARSLINGEIPEDVLQQITRNRAQLNAGQGVPGSQRQATARDLGLTSLGLQQQGASLFTQINAIRDSVDPISRQIGLNQLQISPQAQIEADLANNISRSSADPIAAQLFQNSYAGLREEAFARSGVSVPVNNTLGAGLSGAGGALTGLLKGGAFSRGGTAPTPTTSQG